MAQVARQNDQAMNLGCGGYRNVLKTRPMGAGIIKNLTGGMRACQIERQKLRRVPALEPQGSILASI
ncbi:hypothetical protein ASD31_22525 [Rhizobium sp. Root482]|nr:hypothetical protein ASD31_22525 [Rhizobium sp. Root482]